MKNYKMGFLRIEINVQLVVEHGAPCDKNPMNRRRSKMECNVLNDVRPGDGLW
jgi:hypothetical protein